MTISSKGEVVLSDTTVTINIDLIRKANAKMIERLYLIDINERQDSIINYQNQYIKEQSIIIDDFQNKIIENQKINQDLYNTINKQRKNQRIIYSVTGAAIVGIVVGLILK